MGRDGGDRIELRGLRLSARCGVLPEERERAQPLEVDLDLYVDLAPAGQSDDLDDTVDYGAVCELVEKVCAAGAPRLLEHLANSLATRVARRDRERFGDGRDPQAQAAGGPATRHLGGAHLPRPPGLGEVTRAFLGLGSNLADRERYLRDAIETLGDTVTAVSAVYETEPVGGPAGQGHYLNLVVEIETDLAPRELLAVCQRIESAAERVRAERWGPRTLDVDVLWIDGVTMDDDALTVPHPRMRGRRFVLEPLAELAPELVDPEDLRVAAGTVQRLGMLGG